MLTFRSRKPRYIDIKNKSEPLDVHEVVRICSVWWPVREFTRPARSPRETAEFIEKGTGMRGAGLMALRGVTGTGIYPPYKVSTGDGGQCYEPIARSFWVAYYANSKCCNANFALRAVFDECTGPHRMKKALRMECSFCGDRYGNRTHVFSVRGWCLSRLTNRPCVGCSTIIQLLFVFVKGFLKSFWDFFKNSFFRWKKGGFEGFWSIILIFL